MAKDKTSFLLYCDLIHTVKKMSKDKAGELFLTILEYVNDENPVVDDIIIDLVFEPIKQQLKRDLKSYEKICERNSLNGSKGGRPKTINLEEPKKPTGLSRNPSKPKKADSDNGNDTDSGIEKEKKKTKQAEFVFLFKSEYEKLVSDYGKVNADKLIKELDNYKGANGKKYKSDYRAILSWVVKKVLGDNYHSSSGPNGVNLLKFKVKHRLGEIRAYECETLDQAKKIYSDNFGVTTDEIFQV